MSIPNTQKAKRVRTVIVGTGLAFRAHLSGYRRCKHLKMHGIVTSTNQEIAKQLGIATYASLEDALNDQKVEAIDLVVPTGFHADMAISAMRSGKHVLIEKPLDTDPAKARQIVEESKKHAVIASYVSQYRSSAGIELMKEILADNGIGELICVNCTQMIKRDDAYYSESPWRANPVMSGGGILIMNGIHIVDSLCYLLGHPEVVAAKVICTSQKGFQPIDDTASIILSFRQSITATLVFSKCAGQNHPSRIEFVGRKGRVVLTEFNPVPMKDKEGSSHYRIGKSPDVMFAEQLDDFGSAIRYGTELRTPLEEGLISLETIYRAYEMGNYVQV
jgi:predicted dehydrogenase